MSNQDSTADSKYNSFSEPEPFVDPTSAAKFISIDRRYLLDLARANVMPGHPIGAGKRRVWRFRLSELADAITEARLRTAKRIAARLGI